MTAIILSNPIDVPFRELKNGDIVSHIGSSGHISNTKYLMLDRNLNEKGQVARVGDLGNNESSFSKTYFYPEGTFRVFARDVK